MLKAEDIKIDAKIRCIDKEGYIGNMSPNYRMYIEYFSDGKVYKVPNVGTVINGRLGECLIDPSEYRYFEVVTDVEVAEVETTPTLWDGEVPLEVGMQIKNQYGTLLTLQYKCNNSSWVCEDDTRTEVLVERDIYKATLDKRQQFFDDVTSKLQSVGLSNAWDELTVREVDIVGMCYDIMTETKGD